jgi:hypothetical protein
MEMITRLVDRWTRWAVVLQAVVLAGVLAAAAPAAQAAEMPAWTWAGRAAASYVALQHYLYLGRPGHYMYLERYPKQAGDNDYSYLFPIREATAATIDVAGMPRSGDGYQDAVPLRFKAIQNYWDPNRTPPGFDSYPPPPLGNAGDPFYDDNAIVGLEYVRQYLATGDRAMLEGARRAFNFDTSGWDTDPTHPCPGGLHWVQASWNTIKATNATGLASELATHLYEATHDRSYLDWGRRLYEWNRTCMRSPEGLYWNDIDFQGNIDKTLWIYNSGAMIGAGTLLYRATGQRAYLAQAQADAGAAVGYWSADDRYFDQPCVFNAIFFANLLLLDSQRDNRGYRPVIQRYADHIWSSNRDPMTGLFKFQPSGGGAFDPSARPETLEQSAAVQIFALLAWDPDTYWRAA